MLTRATGSCALSNRPRAYTTTRASETARGPEIRHVTTGMDALGRIITVIFAHAQRGAVIASGGKTRVTMYLDNDVLQHFRQLATRNGRGYQTEINLCLRHEPGDRLTEPVT